MSKRYPTQEERLDRGEHWFSVTLPDGSVFSDVRKNRSEFIAHLRRSLKRRKLEQENIKKALEKMENIRKSYRLNSDHGLNEVSQLLLDFD